MVRSKKSCFKMMTCRGGDSSDLHQTQTQTETSTATVTEEQKGSMDKHGWSFRKRSTRHRVLSETVLSSETPSSQIKETQETTFITDSYPENISVVPQKMSLSKWMEETTSLPTPVTAEVATQLVSKIRDDEIDTSISRERVQSTSLTGAIENTHKISHNLEEVSAIIIQASIRGYLAQRSFLKLKNIIKLQAAFRGHLERRHALGTLRCVQAIVKMQVLVRARRARVSLQESAADDKIDGKNENSSHSRITLGLDQTRLKAIRSYSSTQKLLSNGFARQLLESAPKKNCIHIRCDPSKSDSAWKWMERWVSVSQDSPRAQKLGRIPGNGGISIASKVESGIPIEVVSQSVILKHKLTVQSLAPEHDESLITYDADSFKFRGCHLLPSLPNDVTLKPQVDNVDFIQAQIIFSTDDPSRVQPTLGATSQTFSVPVSNKPEAGCEQPRRSLKRLASEQPETLDNKSLSVSRKAFNHVFPAIQSNFEELSSPGIPGRSNNFSQVGEESRFDGVSTSEESGTRKKENSLAENLIFHEPRVHVEGSDCGTELSISSTLDSPDRFEIRGMEFARDMEIVEKTIMGYKAVTNGSVIQNHHVEFNNCSVSPESDSSYTISQQGKHKDANSETFELSLPVISAPLEQQPESHASSVQIRMGSLTNDDVNNWSPEGSPESYVNIPEKDRTLSSQVYVKANKGDKSGSSQRKKSLSASKKFSLNPSHDTSQSSTGKLRDYRYRKRQNSIGLSMSDQDDQDPRDSTSSLPSYMQATESAKAKALTNNSPKSSPNLQEKDISVKKRHSLPGANVKQVAPRIQRSLSQSRGAKGNGACNQDRTWQR